MEELVDQPERHHLAREAGAALHQHHLAGQVRRDRGQVDEAAGPGPQLGDALRRGRGVLGAARGSPVPR